MSRMKVTPTDVMKEAIQDYADKHGLSWGKACLHLASVGLQKETDTAIDTPSKKHGGKRTQGLTLMRDTARFSTLKTTNNMENEA